MKKISYRYLLYLMFTSIPVASRGRRSIASAMFCCWFSTYPASLFCKQKVTLYMSHKTPSPVLVLTWHCSIQTEYVRKYDMIIEQSKQYLTLTLLLESISRSATSESNFSWETSGMSGFRFKLFFNKRTLPIASQISIISAKIINFIFSFLPEAKGHSISNR